MRRAVALAVLLALPALSGCAFVEDLVDQATRPDLSVARTDLQPGEWNTQRRFQVVVQEPVAYLVRIEATSAAGRVLSQEGLSDAEHPVILELDDGTWTIRYWVDGHDWETLSAVRIDATPPVATGLEPIGSAQDGQYTIQAVVEAGARVRVVDMQTGRLLATELPHTVTGLVDDRVYAFLVAIGDVAGNWNNQTVQVRSGSATELPTDGAYSFGVIARYTNEIQLWDVADLGAYASPAEARAATDAGYLGAGFGITPDEPSIQAVVAQVVDPSMDTTGEIAFALYAWMFDHLDYDDGRLGTSDLLEPSKTLERGGGVCRDLAGLYVSLLRAAGVPARVVSGYLAGGVNGFHAWVEFYGGSAAGGPRPWVPVDVSPIDGAYEPERALTAFGIQRPDYLTLRDIPPAGETEGWSTALSVRYKYFGGPEEEPVITFEKQVQPGAGDQEGVLCVNAETLRRRIATEADACQRPEYTAFFGDFVLFTERVIDYGILVREAPLNTEITAEVSYPFVDDVEPNEVEYTVYGEPGLVESWRMDAASGNYVAEFRT